MCSVLYRDLLVVLPMREPSIFRGIAVSLLRPVIGSNVEIDVVKLYTKLVCSRTQTICRRIQIIVQIFHFKFSIIY